MKIRQAEISDAASLAVLHTRAWQQAYAGLIRQDFLDSLNPDEKEKNWKTLISNRSADTLSRVWVIEDENEHEVIGWCSVGAGRDNGVSDGQGELEGIYIDPAHQGKGAGKALIVHAHYQLTVAGYTSAYLWVLEGNQSAINFYVSQGWQHTDETKEQVIAGEAKNLLKFVIVLRR